jgi:hypothetical protein
MLVADQRRFGTSVPSARVKQFLALEEAAISSLNSGSPDKFFIFFAGAFGEYLNKALK